MGGIGIDGMSNLDRTMTGSEGVGRRKADGNCVDRWGE
jgi:hypothetical protein